MSNKNSDSLSHSRWNCKYHVVFAPKYRRQVIYQALKSNASESDYERVSSPRPWGCFRIMIDTAPDPVIFPTPVGVFPHCRSVQSPRLHLPHTRGGVSLEGKSIIGDGLSSPHPWGCFQQGRGGRNYHLIFPTPVGVFPAPAVPRDPVHDLPHTRGGVS